MTSAQKSFRIAQPSPCLLSAGTSTRTLQHKILCKPEAVRAKGAALLRRAVKVKKVASPSDWIKVRRFMKFLNLDANPCARLPWDEMISAGYVAAFSSIQK